MHQISRAVCGRRPSRSGDPLLGERIGMDRDCTAISRSPCRLPAATACDRRSRSTARGHLNRRAQRRRDNITQRAGRSRENRIRHPLRRFQHDAASYCPPVKQPPARALRWSGSGSIEHRSPRRRACVRGVQRADLPVLHRDRALTLPQTHATPATASRCCAAHSRESHRHSWQRISLLSDFHM